MTKLMEPAACEAIDSTEGTGKYFHEILKEHPEDRTRFPLYHGSGTVLEAPLPGYGSTDRDFGQGLYCTTYKEYAREWAVTDGRDGYMNSYTLDTTGLKFLDLSKKGTSVLYWLAAVMDNRVVMPRFEAGLGMEELLLDKYLLPLDSYDVICGWPADDVFFHAATRFVFNNIPVQQLITFLHCFEDRKQVVLRSGRAFAQLSFAESEPVSADECYPKRMESCRMQVQIYHHLDRHRGNFSRRLHSVDIQKGGFNYADTLL